MKTIITRARHLLLTLVVMLCGVGEAMAWETDNTFSVPCKDYQPNGNAFSYTMSGFNSSSTIWAKIDLTGCTAATENVLSLGKDITAWNGKVLHIYYIPADDKPLQVNLVDNALSSTGNNDWRRYKSELTSKILEVKLSDGKLYINGDEVKSFTNGTEATASECFENASFFSMGDIQIGSNRTTESGNLSHAKYSITTDGTEPSLTQTTTGEMSLPISKYTATGEKFWAKTTDLNTSKVIYASMNLTNCQNQTVSGKSKPQNILSVGNNIGVWGSEQNYKGSYNLHFYYDSANKKLQMDFTDREYYVDGNVNKAGYAEKSISVSNPEKVEIEISTDGIKVDGTLYTDFVKAMAEHFWTLAEYEIGSKEGSVRSTAYYETVELKDKADEEELSLPLENKCPEKKFYFDIANFNSKKIIKAQIDLTTCKDNGNNENILSIGNDISSWNENKSSRNLHLYFNKKEGKLIVDWKDNLNPYSGDKDGKCEEIITDYTKTDPMKIEISYSGGLKINDRVIDTDKGTYINEQLRNCLFAFDNVQVGSNQGATTYATYTYLNVEDVVTENGVFGDRLPWNNVVASGNQTFIATEPVNFDKQYVEAEIDLSNCKTYEEGDSYEEAILSIGTDIAQWAPSGNKANLHIYYNKANHRLTFDFTNAKFSGTKEERFINLPENVTTVKLKVAASGITINGKSTIGTNSGNLNNYLPYLPMLTRNSTIEVGSVWGNVKSTATYNYVKVVDMPESDWEETIDIPQDGYTPTVASDKFKAYLDDIDFAKQTIRLTIDLANCTSGKNENIFSIGNGIRGWGDKGIYNIHAYYNSNGGLGGKNLQINFLDNGKDENKNRHKWEFTPTSNAIVVEISDMGLTVNGETQNSEFTGDKLYNLLSQGDRLMLGSLEGETHVCNATYTIEVVENDDARSNFSKLWISSPLKVADHKEAAHATLIPYASTSAMTADATFYAEPWQQPTGAMVENLNGTWKFNYVKGTEDGPGDSEFYTDDTDDTDDSSWKDITVPMSWETAGHGTPVYTNIGYPFNYEPPFARTSNANTNEDDNNATGFYRRSFTVPADWNGKRIFVHFDGVYSAAVVWVNGKYVGYSQGANTDAEFDITDAIDASKTDQQLSVRVYRWCDGSYFEGQDMWHLSGIHRDVYLKAVPKVFVSDHVITTEGLATDATSASKLNVALTVDNRAGASATKTFDVTLKNAEGKTVATGSATYTGTTTQTVNVELTSGLTGLTAWTAETPYLYTVEVSQKDNGTEEMAFSTKYGFRNITIESGVLKVNGKRIYIKGVNSHDTNPTTGKALSMDDMLKDIRMMKRANINTFRGSHYPRQPKMYAMFDAMGMYVIPSADIECHYNWTHDNDNLLTSKANWLTAMKDRTERMVRRDINHASVIVWSLGNESGKGTNFKETYNQCKALDASRPVHYEGDDSSSDFLSYMYPTLGTVQGWAGKTTTKPYIMCEYVHAMGQAVGNMKEYWDAVEASDHIAGGCIWDWADQALYKIGADKKVNGFNNWAAGYDYNTVSGNQFQGNFLDNGLVTPDRRWTAKLAEVKKVYQDASFESFNGTTLTVKNKSAFINLDDYKLVYRILRNGRIVEEKQTAMPSVEPGKEATIDVSYTTSIGDNAEYAVNFELQQKTANDYAEAGYVVADEQFVINPNGSTDAKSGEIGEEGNLPTLADYAADSNAGTLSVAGNTVTGTDADGKAFSLTFDGGRMTAWTYGEKSIVAAGPDFNSRRNIDNDVYSKVTLGVNTSSVSVAKALALGSDGNATMSVSGSAEGCTYTIAYTIYPDATVDMSVKFTPSAELRRIGLGMQFAEGFENVEYYGRGPWSNYVDRKTASYLGRYYTTVDDMVEEMIHPQTYGDRQDLRELTLTDYADNIALNIETAGRVAFSLSHYDESTWCSRNTLWNNATHWYDLTRSDNVFAHFDYWQRGLGNNSCGAEQSLKKYQCPTSGTYSYTLRMKPQTAE